MRTNELKKLVMSQLSTLKQDHKVTEVYHKEADDDYMYPHIVFNLDDVNPYDLKRRDYSLEVHCWDQGPSTTHLDDIMDDIEDLLHVENLPQNMILPTFFLESRGNLEDEDKQIQHGLLLFTVQNYER